MIRDHSPSLSQCPRPQNLLFSSSVTHKRLRWEALSGLLPDSGGSYLSSVEIDRGGCLLNGSPESSVTRGGEVCYVLERRHFSGSTFLWKEGTGATGLRNGLRLLCRALHRRPKRAFQAGALLGGACSESPRRGNVSP